VANWIIETIGQFGYLGIFLLMVLESLFPPIPSELVIPFAGFAAMQGTLSLPGVIAAATLGALAGMVPWYIAGRLFGLGRLRALANRFGRVFTLNAEEVDTATEAFRRHGPIIVLVGRLLPIIRTLISVPAGLARMPAHLFFAASLVGALIWNLILVGAGALLAANYGLVEKWLDPVTTLVIVSVVAIYIYRFIRWRPGGAA
jgi:membrane protein DedA with SNARE-associated domain